MADNVFRVRTVAKTKGLRKNQHNPQIAAVFQAHAFNHILRCGVTLKKQ